MTDTSARQGRGRRAGWRAVTVVVVVLVLAGLLVAGLWVLRAAGEDEAQAATSDPCALATRDEVARHVGRDDLLGAGKPQPPGSIPPVKVAGMQWCKYPQGEKGTAWIGATPPGADTRYAKELFGGWVCDQWGDAFTDCEQWQQELRQWQAEGEAPAGLDPVSDVGVAAVWVSETKTLVVLSERQVLAFHVRRCANRFRADAGERDRATLLAETVLARNARRVIDEEASADQPEGAQAGEVPDLAPECSADDSSADGTGPADAAESSGPRATETQTPAAPAADSDRDGGGES